uniref:Uncharacterized protein n=1 Tax=Anguilla anguilla TaxID=7936 RepID=A0A0E9TF86_ANGAN
MLLSFLAHTHCKFVLWFKRFCFSYGLFQVLSVFLAKCIQIWGFLKPQKC